MTQRFAPRVTHVTCEMSQAVVLICCGDDRQQVAKRDAARSPSDATRRVTVMTQLRYADVPNRSLCVGVKGVMY